MCSAKMFGTIFAIAKLRTIQTSVMDSQKSKAREPSLHDTWKVEHPAERASAEHVREPVAYLAWSSGSWRTPLSSGTTVRLVYLSDNYCHS